MTRRLPRRAALLLPLGALPGCGLLDSVFGSNKPPLPGRREAVLAARRGLEADPAARGPVALPPPARVEEWPQTGGGPAHAPGNLAVTGLNPAWSASVGRGGGYRRKLTAQPAVAGGRLFAMDSDAAVGAFDVASGGRVWRRDTQDKGDRSTNIGGGIAVAGDTVYATTGRADVLALDAATGEVRWRKPLGAPARSAPTLAEGRLFATTLDGKLLCLGAADGERQWAYQAEVAPTTLLALPAPAYAEGLVVAGFGSGEIVAVRADSGGLAWSDSLASARGRNSLLDLSAIRAAPVVDRGRVYAVGVGGLLVALDLRSGRRLWEREAGGDEAPAVAGDWLFVLTSEQTLAAIGREDGRVRWTRDLPRYGDPERQRDPILWTGPLLANSRLLLAGSNERMTAVDAATGEVVGTQRLSGAAALPPLAAAGSVFVLTDGGTLQAFR